MKTSVLFLLRNHVNDLTRLTRAEKEYVLRIPMCVLKGDWNGILCLNYGAVHLTAV